jgi:hypothetical protein
MILGRDKEEFSVERAFAEVSRDGFFLSLLLACPKFPLLDSVSKNLFGGLLREGTYLSSASVFEAAKALQTLIELTYQGNCTSVSFSQDSFGHQMVPDI